MSQPTAPGGPPPERRRLLPWWAVVALALVPAAANGIGRFGYGLILPAMRAEIGWSALAAGLLNAANAAGYLLGAVLADRLLVRLGDRVAVLGSLAVSTAAVLGCAATSNLPILLILRMLAGGTGAVAFIAGAVIVARSARPAGGRAGQARLGVYFAGVAFGVAVTAPLITPFADAGQWRLGWVLLAAACAGCLLLAGLALRRVDTDGPTAGPNAVRRRWRTRRVRALLVAYGLFGAGYIAYMTFAVAYLRGAGSTSGELVGFWFSLGAAGVVVGLTAVAPLGAIRSGRGVAVLVLATAVGSALPLISVGQPLTLASAVLFGCFFSVTAVATACMQHQLTPAEWPPAIAGLTAVFGLGQCLGPLLSGALSDTEQGLRAGLLTGTLLLAASTACALLQRAHPPEVHARP